MLNNKHRFYLSNCPSFLIETIDSLIEINLHYLLLILSVLGHR